MTHNLEIDWWAPKIPNYNQRQKQLTSLRPITILFFICVIISHWIAICLSNTVNYTTNILLLWLLLFKQCFTCRTGNATISDHLKNIVDVGVLTCDYYEWWYYDIMSDVMISYNIPLLYMILLHEVLVII